MTERPIPFPAPVGLDDKLFFPVVIIPNAGNDFKPLSIVQRAGKTCVCQNPMDGFKPKWGGGFYALRGNLYHQAIDIMAPIGATVVAVDAGKVKKTVRVHTHRNGKNIVVTTGGSDFGPIGGNFVWIEHSWGTSYYAHLHEPARVKSGDTVLAGQSIGLVGVSGNATGGCPHLHFACETSTGRKMDAQALLHEAYENDGWKAESWEQLVRAGA